MFCHGMRLFLLLVLGIALVSCNEPTASSKSADKTFTSDHDDTSNHDDDPGSGEDGGFISGGDDNSGSDGGVISRLKPALAIRATGCVMCHARVEATVITDFGYRDPYFFGANVPSGFSPFSGSIYGDHAENWRSARIWGKVYAPQAPIQHASFVGTLAEFLRNRLSAPDANSSVPEVVEKSSIFIGAPTEQRLVEIAGDFPPSHPEWKYFPDTGTEPISGFETAPGRRYVRNVSDGELVCSGDLFVREPVILNNLKLRTGNRGCRIYAMKSAFIQGPITYLGDAPFRNLQVTSARAMVMGLGPGAVDGSPNNTLSYRLRDFWTRFTYFTRDTTRSTQEKLDAIVLDSSYITELSDASAQLPHRRSLSFERLLVNAPNYQSRYQGQFKGVIIAEMALASLGNFSFLFDPVFENTAILPRLSDREILKVE